MTVSDWVTVAAALVGAVVGGAMALVGAVFVGRREQPRATRMRLLEALDVLRSASLAHPNELAMVDLCEVHRAAALLGRRERKVARELERLADVPLPSPPRRSPAGADAPEENPSVMRYRQAREQMIDLTEVLERLVLRRLARVLRGQLAQLSPTPATSTAAWSCSSTRR
jgi:hypothetical protein